MGSTSTVKLLTYSPLHPVWSHRDITCDITIQFMGYRWLPIGATSVHKTVLIDAVHSGTLHSGTVCCAGRDPYPNMTVHLVSGGSMSTCTPPPPASSCHSKPATQSWPQPPFSTEQQLLVMFSAVCVEVRNRAGPYRTSKHTCTWPWEVNCWLATQLN